MRVFVAGVSGVLGRVVSPRPLALGRAVTATSRSVRTAEDLRQYRADDGDARRPRSDGHDRYRRPSATWFGAPPDDRPQGGRLGQQSPTPLGSTRNLVDAARFCRRHQGHRAEHLVDRPGRGSDRRRDGPDGRRRGPAGVQRVRELWFTLEHPTCRSGSRIRHLLPAKADHRSVEEQDDARRRYEPHIAPLTPPQYLRRPRPRPTYATSRGRCRRPVG